MNLVQALKIGPKTIKILLAGSDPKEGVRKSLSLARGKPSHPPLKEKAVTSSFTPNLRMND